MCDSNQVDKEHYQSKARELALAQCTAANYQEGLQLEEQSLVETRLTSSKDLPSFDTDQQAREMRGKVMVDKIDQNKEHQMDKKMILKMCQKEARVDLSRLKIVEFPPVEIDIIRYRRFMVLLHRCCFEKNQAQSLEIDVVRKFFAEAEKINPFNDWEFDACIKKMEGEKKVMTDQNIVYII